jgi:protein-L-isoaspartate O-methyltransferase
MLYHPFFLCFIIFCSICATTILLLQEFVDIGKSVFDAIKTPASESLLKRIELHAIDARALTYESSSTFDVIHAGAAIPLSQVEAYKRMLKVDGILVGPVQESEEKQAFVKYTKRADGSIQREELLGVIYAKLQDLDAQLRPQGR